MKIFHVLNYFLPNQIGGTEIYVNQLAKKLQNSENEIEILVPNYSKDNDEVYYYNGLKVYKYPEQTPVDRSLISGLTVPQGLGYFISYLINNTPDIIHFHEIAGSNGITVLHVVAAKELGIKVLMTFHLALNTCTTGLLYYKKKELCNGNIDLKKCTSCYLNSKVKYPFSEILTYINNALHSLNLDASKLNSSLGTALSITYFIKKRKATFNTLINCCDKIIVLTNWYKQVLLENGVNENNIQLIEQGSPHFHKIERRGNTHNKNNKILKLIYIGRITDIKGINLLISAVTKTPSDLVILDIYGDDNNSYAKKLKDSTLNIRNINWKGILEPNLVITTLLDYDALCLCSKVSEMAPLVIQEAFSAGIPVIASNVPGNAEYIKHDINGLLFPFNDLASLINCINRCLSEPDLLAKLRLGISPPRTFDDVAAEHLKLYSDLIG